MQSTEITIRKEGGRSLFQSINMENGNASFLTECNNLRAHVTMNTYNNILQLLQRMRGNDNIDKLAFEILKKKAVYKRQEKVLPNLPNDDEKSHAQWTFDGYKKHVESNRK